MSKWEKLEERYSMSKDLKERFENPYYNLFYSMVDLANAAEEYRKATGNLEKARSISWTPGEFGDVPPTFGAQCEVSDARRKIREAGAKVKADRSKLRGK